MKKPVKITLVAVIILAIVFGVIYLIFFMPRSFSLEKPSIMYNRSTEEFAQVTFKMNGKNAKHIAKDPSFVGDIEVIGAGFDKVFKNVHITYPPKDVQKIGYIVFEDKVIALQEFCLDDENAFTITFYDGVYVGGEGQKFALCVGATDKASAEDMLQRTFVPMEEI